MSFLISREKRPSRSLFLVITALIAACLFVLVPLRVSANAFYVVTQFPTQLDKRMSVLSGFVSNDSEVGAYVWFEYGRNGRFEKSSYKQKAIGTRDFTSRIYDIEPGVLYSYRAVGRKQNSNVIKHGDTKTFIIDGEGGGSFDTSNDQSNNTSDSSSPAGGLSCEQFCAGCCTSVSAGSSVKPVISSGSAPLTTNTTATLSSTVLTGGVPTRGWFEWGTTRSLGRVTPAKKLGSAPRVEMKETISGLSQDTTYYYRSVAVTSACVNRSAIANFTTQGERSDAVGKADAENSFSGENTHDQTTQDATDKNLTDSNNSEDKIDNKGQDLDKDSLGGVFAWGSTLRGQFFTIDEKGNINTGISFNETKKEKQNFLLAGALSGQKFLPDTWSEWGLTVVLLYIVISRTYYFFKARKKRKKETKEREEEMQRARELSDVQIQQTNSGGVPA